MKAQGTITLKAATQYARYAVACSAGSTIAMGKDGRTLESVVVKFYKLSTDGVMAPFAAPTAEARRTSRDGTTSLPRMHAGKAEVDLTDWVNGFAAGTLASVEVSVYGDGGELLAQESFAAVYPGDDAEVWFITLSDAYYRVDAKGSVSAKLAGTLYHRKGGTTEPAGGAVLKFGYSDGITNTVTTGRDGRFDDSGWFAGDVWDDASTANSSKSIYVSYERDGVVETSQLVTLSRDGGQGEPGTPGADGQGYALHLTTGPAVQMTAYAGLKGGTVGVYLTKDGAAVNASFKVELYGDTSGTGDPVANTDGYMIEAPVFNVGQLINAAVGGGKAPYLVTASAKVGGAVVAADRFSIVYDTARPFVRAEEWSEGLTFRNGDIIRYRKEATAGAAAKDYVFQWNYPVGGNSAVNPFDDVRDNRETTHWADYEYYALLATRVLLADFALVGGAVFMDDYMISRHGTMGGAESDDYTKFDENDPEDSSGTGEKFVPTLYLDFKTGATYQTAGRIGGFEIRKNYLEYSESNGKALSRLSMNGYSCAVTPTNNETYVSIGEDTVSGYGTFDAGVAVRQTGANGATHVGVYSETDGGKLNFAFFGKGDVVSDGKVCGYNVGSVITSSSKSWDTMQRVSLDKASVFVVTGVADGNFALPTYKELLASLGVSSTSRWLGVEVTLMNYSGWTQVVYGDTDEVDGTKPGVMPRLYNGGRNPVGKVSIGDGCVAKVLLMATLQNTYVAKVFVIK